MTNLKHRIKTEVATFCLMFFVITLIAGAYEIALILFVVFMLIMFWPLISYYGGKLFNMVKELE